MDPVKRTTKRGVLTVTLADAENRNALDGALVQGIHDAIAAANADPAIRAVVLTNEGNTFCAGANLKQRAGASQSTQQSTEISTKVRTQACERL